MEINIYDPRYYLWKWNNKNLFEEGFKRPENAIETIMHIVKKIEIDSQV